MTPANEPWTAKIRSLDERADRELTTIKRATSVDSANRKRRAPGSYVELIEATTLTPEPVRWLWPGWLARGKLHVLAGAPGTGKTTLTMDMAACVSAGRPLPSGWRPSIGNVLVWSGEDDPSDTLLPRLLAAGADLSRVKFVGDVHEDGKSYPFDPARDVGKLAAAAARIGEVALLIVDPLVSAVSGDSHKNAEVRRSLAPLVDLAVRMDAALIGITHYSKGTGGREPLERVSGSLAFGALARVVLGTVRQQAEEGQPQTMMLARAKSNIGPDGGGFTYTFEQTELAAYAGLIASRIVWGTAVDGTARDLLAEPSLDEDRSESGECAEWLRTELNDGERDAAAMKREGGKLGYSQKVIRRAREKLGIKPVKAAFNKGWTWALPAEDAHGSVEDAQHAQQNEVGTFGGNGHLREHSAESEGFDL